MTLKKLGEFGFIRRIAGGTIFRNDQLVLGIGDDCGVYRVSKDTVSLITTDILVEGIHFLRDRTTPLQLGRKSLAVNLSDIAAMGGAAREAVIAIAVPESVDLSYLESVYEGLKEMASEYEVNLIGGDTASAPEHLVISITVIGEAKEKEVLYRSGARADDLIFLTGPVGSAAAGLDMILSGRSFEDGDELLTAHLDPRPHLVEGRTIAQHGGATSLIDVSDGIASDLAHICTESSADRLSAEALPPEKPSGSKSKGKSRSETNETSNEQTGSLGAVIEEAKIPLTDAFLGYCETFEADPAHLALHVGEDYVLLGTVPESKSRSLAKAVKGSGGSFHLIGRMESDSGIRLQSADGTISEIKPRGWDHFKRA